jgi:hypothetical protein
MLTIGRGRSIPANRAQIGGEYLRVIGPRIVEDSLMAVRDNRAIELVVPEHFKCLALGVVVDASEPRANECLSAVYALNKPMPRAAVATATPQAIALIRRQDSGRALEDVAGALRIAGSSAEMFGACAIEFAALRPVFSLGAELPYFATCVSDVGALIGGRNWSEQ